MRTGVATIPLDWGKCPPWLFLRMKKLSRSIFLMIANEFGPDEILLRLSDPSWFQALGSVLGFDWNSSGLTTTTLGAVKSAIFDIQDEIGIYICGGKGKTSKKTPEEIETYGISRGFSFSPYLIFASKMSAKVDSSLLQDGFQIYHHSFLFTKSGNWAVIQQGMNLQMKAARRYHWRGGLRKNFIEEPHAGIISQKKFNHLNLSAKNSKENRNVSLDLMGSNFGQIEKDLNLLSKNLTDISSVKKINLPDDSVWPKEPKDLNFNTSHIKKTIFGLVSNPPRTFTELLYQKGVGPKTIRALSLISELIYGAKPSYEDPSRYSFAHGGKDGVPYPVDLDVYEKTISIMEKAIKRSDLSLREKEGAFLRLDKNFTK